MLHGSHRKSPRSPITALRLPVPPENHPSATPKATQRTISPKPGHFVQKSNPRLTGSIRAQRGKTCFGDFHAKLVFFADLLRVPAHGVFLMFQFKCARTRFKCQGFFCLIPFNSVTMLTQLSVAVVYIACYECSFGKRLPF